MVKYLDHWEEFLSSSPPLPLFSPSLFYFEATPRSAQKTIWKILRIELWLTNASARPIVLSPHFNMINVLNCVVFSSTLQCLTIGKGVSCGQVEAYCVKEQAQGK